MKILPLFLCLFLGGCARQAPQPLPPKHLTPLEILDRRLEILNDRIDLGGKLTDSSNAALDITKDCANVGHALWTERKCQQRKDAFLVHLKELEAENAVLNERNKKLDEEAKQ